MFFTVILDDFVAKSPESQSRLDMWNTERRPNCMQFSTYDTPVSSFQPYSGTHVVIKRESDVVDHPHSPEKNLHCTRLNPYATMERLEHKQWQGQSSDVNKHCGPPIHQGPVDVDKERQYVNMHFSDTGEQLDHGTGTPLHDSMKDYGNAGYSSNTPTVVPNGLDRRVSRLTNSRSSTELPILSGIEKAMGSVSLVTGNEESGVIDHVKESAKGLVEEKGKLAEICHGAQFEASCATQEQEPTHTIISESDLALLSNLELQDAWEPFNEILDALGGTDSLLVDDWMIA